MRHMSLTNAIYLIDRSLSTEEMETSFKKTCEMCNLDPICLTKPCNSCKVKLHYESTLDNIRTIKAYRERIKCS